MSTPTASSQVTAKPARVGPVRWLIKTVAPGLMPPIQAALVRVFYSYLALRLRSEDPPFLNYGCASLHPDSPELKLEPNDEIDRLAIQLYARVVGTSDLRGKDVLEIGCGRGGGASFVRRYLQPASVTGVDLSAKAIRDCQRRHSLQGLKFMQGEAGNLPLPAKSFDTVLNVESSHWYPSFEGFLSEVERVLRPNGSFLFADLRPSEKVAELRDQLRERFTVVEEELITDDVVRALKLDSERRSALILKRIPKLFQEPVLQFAGVSGSPVFEAFSSGSVQYVRFALQKRA